MQFLLNISLLALPLVALGQESAPPSQALLRELCQQPRVAGTPTSERATDMVARVLGECGFVVALDKREVLLSLPRRLSVQAYPDANGQEPFVSRLWNYDPDAIPAGDIPPFNAWSASGLVRAMVLDVGYGTRSDFERLKEARIKIKGTIAIARYGKGYRGNKLSLAEEFGCAGMLLFSDPKDDGAKKGPTWPKGPWKSPNDAQRGSVGPMGRTPGDPSTPGFASPLPGRNVGEGQSRLTDFALAQALPKIPCMPIGAADAAQILSGLGRRRLPDAAGKIKSVAIGPGPTTVRLEVDAPREVRTITNVIGSLQGTRPNVVMAGNHRDSWVRGAHDAGSGTVTLLRAAQHLAAQIEAGWKPQATIYLAFWDAEEQGLIGSTEWVELHQGVLSQALSLYINADAAVSGPNFNASGSPGLEPFLAKALFEMEHPEGSEGPFPSWLSKAGQLKNFSLPGSGSDFAPFLHHLGLPVLDISFSGNRGGQYHTAYDDVPMVERFLDPGYKNHELAGRTMAALLTTASEMGRGVFSDSRAARDWARRAREARDWMGIRHSGGIAASFDRLANSIDDANAKGVKGALRPPMLYRGLLRTEGLPLRPWFRNALWTPDQESGYGSQSFPVMHLCIDAGSSGALDFEVERLIKEIEALAGAWKLVPRRKDSKDNR
ncbi:MAG: N-acetylated-alpha-linked acidic dipeptidase [Planctomycetota bacterium]|jgi:N-acetylated-alpha-linked acidic dipeptidase